MKRTVQIGLVALLVSIGGFFTWQWKKGEPRRLSLASMQRLDTALRSADNASLLDALVLPASLQSRTPAEQTEFIRKALGDELSPDGLAVLRKEGRFGPLKEIFPQEAQGWANQAGVKVEDCVAFKLERNGQRCQVVLTIPSTLNVQPSTGEAIYRILRCNNVAQMVGRMPNDEVQMWNVSGRNRE